MDLLIRTCLFLWIAVGYLSMASEPCKDDEDKTKYSSVVAHFKHVFRNVCFEFAEGHETWSQARGACTQRGGELLKVMNCPVKKFLQNFTKERNTANHTWWVGEGLLGEYQESMLGEWNTLPYFYNICIAYWFIKILSVAYGSSCTTVRHLECGLPSAFLLVHDQRPTWL